MPELPEVETVSRGLAKVLVGQRFARVEVRRAGARMAFPEGLAEKVQGRAVVSVTRRAKYILIELDDGQVLLVHLGMSGRMVVGRANAAPPDKHDHLIFHLADSDLVVKFNDPRRFGLCDLTTREELPNHSLLRDLGIEPLEPCFTAAWLEGKLQGKGTSIKAALLDQRLIAGIGNIYACEALYRAGISPLRRAGDVTKEEIRRLVPAIRDVLKDAIKAGGSTLRDYVQATGERGYFQHNFAVYGREGEACPACEKGTCIKRVVQNGRSSFYCEVRQK